MIKLVKLSSYINVLHPSKLTQFLQDENEVNYVVLAINLLVVSILSLAVRFYSSLINSSGKFSLFSLIWPDLGFFIVLGLLDFIACRYGSKTNFVKLCYLLSFLTVSVNILTIPLYFMMPSADSSLALVGCIMLIPMLIIGLYSLYRHYLIFRSIYPELTGNNAKTAYIVSIGIMFFISLVLVSFFNFS